MKLFIAGSNGMVGSAFKSAYRGKNHNLLTPSRAELDYFDYESTLKFMLREKPDLVIDAAATVGGIHANNTNPVKFLDNNLSIQNNLMRAAHVAKVSKFVFLGSSCIYPRNSPQPIKEEYLLTGPLESTNSAYAIAKIAGLELIRAYRKEFGHQWIALMPTNLYGPHDNFDLSGSHVLPALIRRFVEATDNGTKKVTLWGSGTPRREFLHVDDLVRAVLLAVDCYDADLHLNIGSGRDLSIAELAEKVARTTGFDGAIEWDTTKPDGTPRKILDISRIEALGWKSTITLEDGIASTIAWYKEASTRGGVRK